MQPRVIRSGWHLFCKVVDNLGDAALAWRLARLLATEHALDVTVWIDQPDVLARLAGCDPRQLPTAHPAISVRALSSWRPHALPAAVVDLLGGGIPDGLRDALAKADEPPPWFVLEYLSAEPWVDGAHGLPSPDPRTGVARRFWFPGFTARTGGLPRERDLLTKRDAFWHDGESMRALWRTLRLADAPAKDAIRVSVFCYPDAPLEALLNAWSAAARPTICLLPAGIAAAAVRAWAGSALSMGANVERGSCRVHVVPFVDQDRYDELLWACHVNFVRGEDSFVRGQWAARPLVWQPYAQEQGTHVAKMNAFLDRYTAGLPTPNAIALRALWAAWNGTTAVSNLADAWTTFATELPSLTEHADHWCGLLATLPELATGMVREAVSARYNRGLFRADPS